MTVSTKNECPTTWTDHELLTQVLCQDEVAWKEFVTRFRPLIYRCIQKVLCRFTSAITNTDADEVFAEVLMCLLRHDMRKLRAFDNGRGTKLTSWLGMISINATYDFLRITARRPGLDRFEGVTDKGENTERSPLENVLEKERWKQLNQVIKSFSERDRTFLDLYYAKGLAPEVIAKRMAISLKTVYSKKHKITEHLRKKVRNLKCDPLLDLAAAA